MKRIHTVVALVGLAIAAGGAWWWQHRGDVLAGASGRASQGAPDASAPAGRGGAGQGPGQGAGPGARGPSGPAPVEAGTARALRIVDDAQAVGSLRAVQSVMVRPEVSGRVASIGFQEGQRVRRGQLLVQLDDSVPAAQLKQARAQAGIARTNLQRSRELLAQGFVSQSAVDQNAAALEVAESQVALAEAQLARLRVVAPFDAVAGIRQVNVGDYLKDGADIVALEDLSAVFVDFRLPERYLPQLRTGLDVDVVIDALPGRPFKGRIEALDAQVDANGRSLLVRARMANPGTLRAGMFARARVVFSVREGAVVVPEEALVPQGGEQYLYKVVDGPDGQKVARRQVARIGLRQPGQVEILEGLSPGDRVVIAGQARLRGESAPVRLIDLAAASEPGRAGKPGSPASAAGSSPAGAAAASAAKPA